MKKGEKKGLSPVIATVLLISVALVLAVIIFFWARSFIGEHIEKEGQDIDLVCEQVSFRAEAVRSLNIITIENTGVVPIHRMEINAIGSGEISSIPEFDKDVSPGGTEEITLDSGVEAGDKLILVPILLGESKDKGDYVAKVCDEDYGVEITVSA